MNQKFDPLDPDEWVDAPGCQAFEIAIDMRAYGALAANRVPALQAHLDGCASCTAHALAARNLDAALGKSAPAGNPDWELLHRKMRDRVRRHRASLLLLVLVIFAGLSLYWALHLVFEQPPPSPRLLATIFVCFLIFIGGVLLWKRGRSPRVLAQADVVATYRAEIERNLKSLRSSRKMVLVLIALGALRALGGFRRVVQGDLDGGPALVMSCAFLMGMVVAALYERRSVRRLERELAVMH